MRTYTENILFQKLIEWTILEGNGREEFIQFIKKYKYEHFDLYIICKNKRQRIVCDYDDLLNVLDMFVDFRTGSINKIVGDITKMTYFIEVSKVIDFGSIYYEYRASRLWKIDLTVSIRDADVAYINRRMNHLLNMISCIEDEMTKKTFTAKIEYFRRACRKNTLSLGMVESIVVFVEAEIKGYMLKQI